MEDILVEQSEAMEESNYNGLSTMDLSLLGKGKEFRKLYSYIASLVVLLLMVTLAIIMHHFFKLDIYINYRSYFF